MEKEKLLPCPFCGTEAFLDRRDASFIIMCPQCITVQMIAIERETAIERWNKRDSKDYDKGFHDGQRNQANWEWSLRHHSES